ncbi:MAG: sugar transferase [Bryobacteraceae bacterium]|nr:sugar transferase [Bryobacteraceae bacterium]
MNYEPFKRMLDLAAAVLSLALLSPVLLLVFVLVRLTMGSPVLFHQSRAGFGGRPFILHKFRTMTMDQDIHGHDLPDGARLTRTGAFLRATSLDELPQLWNVLRGEMSLVGPRPLYVHYIDRYSTRQRRRQEVLPGITGWAQVNGRNALTWQDRLELDVWYVEHRSLLLDLRILMLTVVQVIKRDGISAEGQATMQEFQGR